MTILFLVGDYMEQAIPNIYQNVALLRDYYYYLFLLDIFLVNTACYWDKTASVKDLCVVWNNNKENLREQNDQIFHSIGSSTQHKQ